MFVFCCFVLCFVVLLFVFVQVNFHFLDGVFFFFVLIRLFLKFFVFLFSKMESCLTVFCYVLLVLFGLLGFCLVC